MLSKDVKNAFEGLINGIFTFAKSSESFAEVIFFNLAKDFD